jgi:hypothetical protein
MATEKSKFPLHHVISDTCLDSEAWLMVMAFTISLSILMANLNQRH